MSLSGLARVYDLARPTAILKQHPEDFFVEELLDTDFAGEGEHLYLWVEKTGQNTEYVAKQLARALNVKSMDVGFSGLKDRWAVTRQWFSVYVRNRSVELSDLPNLEGVQFLDLQRHVRKLRRGSHQANRFRILLREVSSIEQAESLLERIKSQGFPNYFGLQRFGNDNQNLERAKLWFRGEIKASRSQRSFYLSAARSHLFNLMLGEAITNGDWLNKEGPLYGDPVEGVEPLTEAEQSFFDRHEELVAGLHKNRMTLARRPYKMLAGNVTWKSQEQQIELEFELPPGAFATSLLREVFEVEDVSVRSFRAAE